MALDRSYFERNRASTTRIRDIAALGDDVLQTRLGQHWTIAIMLAHLAFWDRRVLFLLEDAERDGKMVVTEMPDVLNDLSLPQWGALPPREAARLAVESAETLDRRLEGFAPEILEEMHAHYAAWVERSIHRDMHLDEAFAVLGL